MRGKEWLPSHTALMAYYAGKGWPNWRIARKLGFSRKAVQERRSAAGFSNCWQARTLPSARRDEMMAA